MKKDKKHLNSRRPKETAFPKAEELLEQAFHTSAKLSVSRKGITPIKVVKKLNAYKIETFGDILYTKIMELSKQFPKIDDNEGFYLDLIGMIVDIHRLKKNLAQLKASALIIKRLKYVKIREDYDAGTIAGANGALNSYQGRVSSVMKKLGRPLAELKEDSKKLAELPSINFGLPTVVLGGYPNVGKTTILKRITGSSAKIAPYPFTTKQINTGYFELKYEKVQVLDTPGVLDREELNPIESKALAAIKHLAKAVVFILDPTLACGFPLEQQVSLLKRTRENFPKIKFIVLVNKTDIASEDEMRAALEMLEGYRIIKDGEGFIGKEELLAEIAKAVL